jgi:hypothetical protein
MIAVDDPTIGDHVTIGDSCGRVVGAELVEQADRLGRPSGRWLWIAVGRRGVIEAPADRVSKTERV